MRILLSFQLWLLPLPDQKGAVTVAGAWSPLLAPHELTFHVWGGKVELQSLWSNGASGHQQVLRMCISFPLFQLYGASEKKKKNTLSHTTRFGL